MAYTLPLLSSMPVVLGGLLLALLLLLGALLLYFGLRDASDGSEDETGFHPW